MSKKALNILALGRSGITVPRGFHLDETHYREAVARIRKLIVSVARDADALRSIFADIPMPERTVDAINEGLRAFPSKSRFAVRSSGSIVTKGRAVAEDGGEQSLAGQFESYLNVPRDQVEVAVRLCWASLFNRRSIDLFDVDADYIENSAMTVLIQEMVSAAASAVVMTADPLGDGTVGGIELAVGACEAIVSGAVTPDTVLFQRETGHIVERHIGAKEYAIEYQAFARGLDNIIKKPLPQDVRNQLAVKESVLQAIVDVACAIEKLFGRPQDIELVVDSEDKITIVQSRAITRLPITIIPFRSPEK